eukprot:5562245-Pyramimonas_sp.AAC.1
MRMHTNDGDGCMLYDDDDDDGMMIMVMVMVMVMMMMMMVMMTIGHGPPPQDIILTAFKTIWPDGAPNNDEDTKCNIKMPDGQGDEKAYSAKIGKWIRASLKALADDDFWR